MAGEDRLDLGDGHALEPTLDRGVVFPPGAEEDGIKVGIRKERPQEYGILTPAHVKAARPQVANVHGAVAGRRLGRAEGGRATGDLEVEGRAEVVGCVPDPVAAALQAQEEARQEDGLESEPRAATVRLCHVKAFLAPASPGSPVPVR